MLLWNAKGEAMRKSKRISRLVVWLRCMMKKMKEWGKVYVETHRRTDRFG